jgi:hypothetical protein
MVAVCARCGRPATKRIRWFVAGRDMPMFDVCDEHEWAEQQAAGVLNAGRRPERFRVRVTDLPEQLVLPARMLVEQGLLLAASVAALRLYRSCRERDFLPWEAVEYVRAELGRAIREAQAYHWPGKELSLQIALVRLDVDWRRVVERWRAAGAASEDRVSRLLKVAR